MQRFTTLSLLTVSLAAASAAHGQTILAEFDFTDGMIGNALQAAAFTDPTEGLKPLMEVLDDTAGLGSGNALFIESAGSGSEWYVPFAVPATLSEGTSIKYSFDFRLDDAKDLPASGNDQFYVGIFADADNSIGQMFNGATFGTEGGDFDDDTGPIAPDFGMHARIPVGSSNPIVVRANTRMRTEHAGQSGIMSGSGETVASPSSATPDEELINLDMANLGKHTFVGEWGAATIADEFQLFANYTVTDSAGTNGISGDDPFTDPDLATYSDTFHYLVFENIGNFDYVIDNLKIEFIGGASMGITGDYNDSGQVEQGDLDLVLQNWGLDTDISGIPAGWSNDLPMGQIEQTELDGVLSNWGSTSAPDFSGSAVPEPATFALLGGLGLLAAGRRR